MGGNPILSCCCHHGLGGEADACPARWVCRSYAVFDLSLDLFARSPTCSGKRNVHWARVWPIRFTSGVDSVVDGSFNDGHRVPVVLEDALNCF